MLCEGYLAALLARFAMVISLSIFGGGVLSGGRRRGWSVGFLLFGAAAFVAGPFSDVASGAVEALGEVSVDREPAFASAGDVPGLKSEPFGEPWWRRADLRLRRLVSRQRSG